MTMLFLLQAHLHATVQYIGCDKSLAACRVPLIHYTARLHMLPRTIHITRSTVVVKSMSCWYIEARAMIADEERFSCRCRRQYYRVISDRQTTRDEYCVTESRRDDMQYSCILAGCTGHAAFCFCPTDIWR